MAYKKIFPISPESFYSGVSEKDLKNKKIGLMASDGSIAQSAYRLQNIHEFLNLHQAKALAK